VKVWDADHPLWYSLLWTLLERTNCNKPQDFSVSDACALFVLPEYLKMVLSKSVMRTKLSLGFEDMGWSVKLVYTSGVRTGVHMFAISMKAGKSKMRNTYFFLYGLEHLRKWFNLYDNLLYDNISDGDIKGFVFQQNTHKSRLRSMDCKVVQCSNRKCWEPHRFPCKSSFAICVSDIW